MFENCGARGSLKIRDAKITKKIAICAPSLKFVGQYLRNYSMHQQWKKNLLWPPCVADADFIFLPCGYYLLLLLFPLLISEVAD